MRAYLLTKIHVNTGELTHITFDSLEELLVHLTAISKFTPDYVLLSVVTLS